MSFVKIIPPFDIRINFWDKNYQVALINPFSKLYTRDKSKDKLVSSNEMWCIWLHEDPSKENKIRRLPYNQKIDAIKLYWDKIDLEDDIVKECISMYDIHCLSPAARAFKEEEELLIKRKEFMKNSDYSFDTIAKDAKGAYIYVSGKPLTIKGTATELDRMRVNTLKIYQQYDEVRKMFIEEEDSVRVYGGGTEGLLDSGGLIDLEDD